MMPMSVEISWQDYLHIFIRRKWYFIVPFVVVLIGGIVIGKTLPKEYRARTVIHIEEEKSFNPMMRGLSASTPTGSRAGLLRQKILSWTSVAHMINDLKLLPADTPPLQFEQFVRDLTNRVGIDVQGNNMLVIAFRDREPAMAQTIVNTLATRFIAQSSKAQGEESEGAISFLEDQLALYRQDLERSEEQLRKFREVYSTGMPKTGALNKELENLELRLTGLLIENTDEHPAVMATRKQIEELTKERNMQVERSARLAGLEIDPSNWEAIASSQPRQSQELARLTRDYDVSEKLYTNLLQRMEKARITQRLDVSEQGTIFKVLEPARLPLKPFKPNVAQLFTYALGLAVCMGFAGVVTAEYLDHSFRDGEEVKQFLGLPPLGIISTIIVEADLIRRRQRFRRAMMQLAAVATCVVLGTGVSLLFSMLVR